MEFWVDDEMDRDDGACAKPPPFKYRPLLGLAISAVAGVALGLMNRGACLWFLLAAAVLLAGLFFCIRRHFSNLLIHAVLLLLFAVHAALSIQTHSPKNLRQLMARPLEYIDFRGVVLNPARRLPPTSFRGAEAEVKIRLLEINRAGHWQPAEGEVNVRIKGVSDKKIVLPQYGEEWGFRGMVWREVFRETGLFVLPESRAHVDSTRLWFRSANHGFRLKRWCLEQRMRCRDWLAQGLEGRPEIQSVFFALLLGYRDDLSPAMRMDLVSTGTIHIFAISGAHVGMIAAILTLFLRMLGVSKIHRGYWVIPALIVYTITTGAAISAVRACVMASVVLMAPLVRRRSDAPSALAFAALLILLVSPRQLADLGFILSFTAVAGILMLHSLLKESLRHVLQRRGAGASPSLHGPPSFWQRHFWKGRGWLMDSFCLSIAAWFATAPWTAFFFNLVSSIALIINVAVVALAFFILFFGVMSLFFVWFPLLAVASNRMAGVFISMLNACIEWGARVPYGHFYVPSPPGWLVLLWFAGVTVGFVLHRRASRRWLWSFVLVIAVAAGWWHMERRACRLHVLDVGASNVTLIQTGPEFHLVGTGSEFRVNYVMRELRKRGVNRLHTLILTHADRQHIGGLETLLDGLPVQEIWLPANRRAGAVWDEVDALLACRDVQLRRMSGGEEGAWPHGCWWRVLWPSGDAVLGNADQGSMVLHVSRGGAAVLLMDDADRVVEAALLEANTAVAAPILVVGQHGAATASSPDWFAAVNPENIIFSTGGSRTERLPSPSVLARAERFGAKIWRTDHQGGINIQLFPPHFTRNKSGYYVVKEQKD